MPPSSRPPQTRRRVRATGLPERGTDAAGEAATEAGTAAVVVRRRTVREETELGLKRRARRMYRVLAERYPDAHCELDFDSPLQLLVATVLSAQTTDVRVNLVTPQLFAKYHTAADYAAADRSELEGIIQSTGFFRAKSDALIKIGAALADRFGGQVPRRLRDLVTLPGVGRKTANVVLGNAFGVPGITVDTHVGRLVRRFGWTDLDDPVKVESAIGELIPRRDWTQMSHVLIWHGRRTCHARRPACGACPVAKWCPSFGVGETDPAIAAGLVKSGPGTVAEETAQAPDLDGPADAAGRHANPAVAG